jgi:dynactin complex subunit
VVIKRKQPSNFGPKRKPLVFLASSNWMQLLMARKDLKINGFSVLGSAIEMEPTLDMIASDIEDVKRCDKFIFFNSNEMTLHQGAMLGIALAFGKEVFTVEPSNIGVEKILQLPQVTCYHNWKDLLEAEFQLREKYLLKRIQSLEGKVTKLRVKRYNKRRMDKIKLYSEQIRFLQNEHKERFGVR